MNIAFPALLVLLLVLPGILFDYAYRKGFWRSPVSFSPIQNEIGKGILLSLLLNGIAITAADTLPVPDIRFDALLILLTGWPGVSEESIGTYVGAATSQPYHMLAYFLGINLSSLLLGFGLHKLVRGFHLDLRYDWLRFNNEWYYILTGEARIFDVPQSERDLGTIREFLKQRIHVFVTALIDQPGEPVLYWGVLSDFYFDRDGRLDRIVLTEARRRTLIKDNVADSGAPNQLDEQVAVTSDKDRYYPIRGQYFIIRYGEARNLNIDYGISERVDSAAVQETPHVQ